MKIAKTPLLAALTAAAALTSVAAPAAAQGYERHDYGRYDQGGYDQGRYDQGRHDDVRADDRRWNGGRDGNVNQRQERLTWRIEQGVRNGSLTRSEARNLREAAYDVARLEARYRRDGLNGWERADLDRRLDRLEMLVRSERRDRDYGQGYYR